MSEAFLYNLPRFDSASPQPDSNPRRVLLGQLPVDDVIIDQAQDVLATVLEVEPESD